MQIAAGGEGDARIALAQASQLHAPQDQRNVKARESSRTIDAAAAAWAARLDGASLSAEEGLALETWASADARRRGALARALAITSYLDHLCATGADDDPPPARRGPRLWIERRTFLAIGALGMASARPARSGPRAAARRA